LHSQPADKKYAAKQLTTFGLIRIWWIVHGVEQICVDMLCIGESRCGNHWHQHAWPQNSPQRFSQQHCTVVTIGAGCSLVLSPNLHTVCQLQCDWLSSWSGVWQLHCLIVIS